MSTASDGGFSARLIDSHPILAPEPDMAENDHLGLRPAPPSQFELVQADDYSQYLLHSKTEIVAVLRSLVQKKVLLTVHFDQGRSYFVTMMFAIAGGGDKFLIDAAAEEAMNAKALKANRLFFSAILDKVKIQFSLDGLQPAEFDGRPALTGAVPETLLRLQRREFFRLSTPIANPVRLCTTVQHPVHGARPVDIPLLDISGGGVGLMVPTDLASLLEKGLTLDSCKIMLPGEGLLVATLAVRNTYDVSTRSGARYVRIGCEFVDLPAARLTVVQRYIIRIERERKARLSGLT